MSGKIRNLERRCKICGNRCEKQMRYCKLCYREVKEMRERAARQLLSNSPIGRRAGSAEIPKARGETYTGKFVGTP